MSRHKTPRYNMSTPAINLLFGSDNHYTPVSFFWVLCQNKRRQSTSDHDAADPMLPTPGQNGSHALSHNGFVRHDADTIPQETNF
jgi:hypothetical protein